MHLNDEPLSFYDILELTPDATPQEIRSAYLRLKSAYGKDSIAHYSVFSREETEQMLQNVENSYGILSNPEKRRAYDETQGYRPPSNTLSGLNSSNLASLTTQPAPSIDSIFSESPSFQDTLPSALQNSMTGSASLTASTFAVAPVVHQQTLQSLQHSLESVMSDIDMVIRNEQIWSGPAIRRIREAKRISLEDLSDYTRISRTYLHALEEENYARLPAVVYVRGFLQQVSRRLKLPNDLVSRQYLDRMRIAAPEKI